MSFIEVSHLSLGYDHQIVISNLSFSIEQGDFVCIVGPNGAGKSTLIKGILGLLKPMSGEVLYHGLKQNFIGYMPQESKIDKHFPASVEEIVLSGTLNQSRTFSFYSKEDRKRVEEVLNLLGIASLKNAHFPDLSGGQRQKVLLARSLCASTKLLILDEPSNNLDSTSKQELYQILKSLNQNKGMTILMITHDLDHHNLIGNKILSLEKNNYFYGSVEDFVKKVHE
ncbi:MAG: metal ABC transporter ATP-binding protein [Bacilli bacterium]|nr:metal ABC transporter ATP-binding protein [Bacilli bacterium]MBR1749076.1 metal ABC transporter ATP-binding protein [Bacilli bacterium]MBR1817377.1 metal ABC transporter ATP-binding protein [Bacilli bacterium]